MKQILYIFCILVFLSCAENKQQIDNNILNDTITLETEENVDAEILKTRDTEYKILPIDESSSDRSLVKFLNNLKEIVSNKDTSKLFEILDTDIIVSYGGGIFGIKEFAETWKLDILPEKSNLWTTLKRIINMGGTWENDGEGQYFCIPYTQSNKAFRKYKYDFDWYFTAVCIFPEVIVYEKPKMSSKKIALLNYEIVEFDPDFKNDDFTKISTIDNKISGYVETNNLIYSAEAPLIIQKINGDWKITAFAPFD